MKNDRPPAYKHRIWWMRNKKSSLPGLTYDSLYSYLERPVLFLHKNLSYVGSYLYLYTSRRIFQPVYLLILQMAMVP